MGERVGGASLSSEAKEVLRERHSPMHYTEILAELERRGIAPKGREPSATLLAALGRSEGVEAVGRRSGFYKLHGQGSGDVLDKARWIITLYGHDRWMPAEAGVDLAHAVELHFRGESAQREHNGIPDDFWREVPCGHPADPLAMQTTDGHWVCHCGNTLDPKHPITTCEEVAPGPVVACSKCGCFPALAESAQPEEERHG